MISIMLCKFCGSTSVGALWVGIAVGLVFIAVGAEADEILFDEELQAGFVVKLLAARNADFFAADPTIGDRSGNVNGDDAVSETAGKCRPIDDLQVVTKVVLI